MADLIKTIKVGVGELDAKISPEAIDGLDDLYAPKADFDVVAEQLGGLGERFVAATDYNELLAEHIALKAKSELYEDCLATALYYDYPKITFTLGDGLTNARVMKGNSDVINAKEINLFGKNVVVAYNKDGNGYDKGDEVDGAGASDSSAQFNMLVDVVEGKVAANTSDAVIGKGGVANKLNIKKEGTTGNCYRINVTKVVRDFTLNLVATVPVTVTATTIKGITLEDNNKGAIPTSANDLADLIFKVNRGGNAYDIEVTIGGESVACGTDEVVNLTNVGTAKDTYVIAKEHITGDIVITIKAKAVEPEEESDSPTEE